MSLGTDADSNDTQTNELNNSGAGLLPTKYANPGPKPTPPPGQECKAGYIYIKNKCKKEIKP